MVSPEKAPEHNFKFYKARPDPLKIKIQYFFVCIFDVNFWSCEEFYKSSITESQIDPGLEKIFEVLLVLCNMHHDGERDKNSSSLCWAMGLSIKVDLLGQVIDREAGVGAGEQEEEAGYH